MIEILTEVQAKIRKSFVNNKSELSPDLVERITRWRVPFDDLHEDILAPEGEKEHIFFAERMRSRFPTLFSQGYSKESYKVHRLTKNIFLNIIFSEKYIIFSMKYIIFLLLQ